MSSLKLPPEFIQEMIKMLGEPEGERFLASYEKERLFGLRINTLKVARGSAMESKLVKMFGLTPVNWCRTGFYYDEKERPGRHPYHTAGLYYIQEPSAMSAVELLDPQPGETLLDLAAAPGGKTTQIAAKLQGRGLLISNEIHPARAKILAENVERMGIGNAVVTQGTPDELSVRFPLVFDRIMLDAPCSGEGMFRKDENAASEWSPDAVQLCAARQRDILHEAVKMLKAGGRMAYSTCTFNRSENEDNMSWLLDEYPEMELLEERRVWPHLEDGEGHYVALLRKRAGGEESLTSNITRKEKNGKLSGNSKNKKGNSEAEAAAACMVWLKEHTLDFPVSEENLTSFGEALYMLPQSEGLRLTPTLLEGLKVPRAGLKLGTYRKGRFEPDHALALALKAGQMRKTVNLVEGANEVSAYLRGETLAVSPELQGWVLVTLDGFPVGWGKCSGGQLKNHFPKGLRLTGLQGK